MSYLARFHQLANELEKHPKVRLLAYYSFPSVTDESIQKIEQHLGFALDSRITSFYKASNGLQLRWIFENNEDFSAHLHQPSTRPNDWYYATDSFRAEDGVISLLPLEMVFGLDKTGFDLSNEKEEIQFLGQAHSLSDFYSRLQPIDEFSFYCNMAFYMDGTAYPPVLMGDEQRSNFTDSRLPDFNSYLEFLLATKGLCRKRKTFYGQYQGHLQPPIYTDESFWTQSKDRFSLDGLAFEEQFPLANQPGAATTGINTKGMQDRALNSAPVTTAELEQMLREHSEFLVSGGAGGSWQMLMLGGMVIGAYKGSNNSRGKQAIFDMKLFPQELDLQELQFPYSSWCGAWLKYQNFSDSDLEGALLTDAMLEKTIFADCNLKGVDFSRANLKGTSFMNANLQGADFENCDLTDADFRGANLEGARFPGAVLKNVKR